MVKTAGETTGKGLRMRELAEATGLPKSTILHYIAQGLLPEPVRTGRNTAIYDPASVERAKYIKTIQGTYSFPLDKIKKLLLSRDEGKDVTSLVELNAVVFGASEGEAIDEEAFRKATGLTTEQVAELLETHLLLPLEPGLFNRDDINAGRIFAVAYERGINASDLAFYASIAKELVDQEMGLRERLTGHLPDDEDARMTAELTRGARALRNYVIDRAFQRRVANARTLKEALR
jgi:DNA-binding transcriptional MerR regulator